MREDGERDSDESGSSDGDEEEREASGSGSGSEEDEEAGSGSGGDDDSREEGGRRLREGKSRDAFFEVTPSTPPATLLRLARGWQAYVVAVVKAPKA